MTNSSVRLYGHVLGAGSFANVTRGIELALKSFHGRHAGTYGVDDPPDPDLGCEPIPGYQARVGLSVGAPSLVSLSITGGAHKERWLMLAPNSSRIPAEMALWIPKCLDRLLTPSRWGKFVLEQQLPEDFPIHVVPHGVMPEFVVQAEAREKRLLEFRQEGTLVWAHFTSTNTNRKGTRQMFEAWRDFVNEKHTSETSELVVYAEPRGVQQLCWLAEEMSIPQIDIRANPKVTIEQMPTVYAEHHAFMQPSRAEGFGLVPLEALASGIPVAATACTGHGMYMGTTQMTTRGFPGSMRIQHGPLEPLDETAGGEAPAVSALSIFDAFVAMTRHYETMHQEALDGAKLVQRLWSWQEASGGPLEELLLQLD